MHIEYVSVQINGDKTRAENQGYTALGSIEGVYYLNSEQYNDFCKEYGFDSSKAKLVQGEKMLLLIHLHIHGIIMVRSIKCAK